MPSRSWTNWKNQPIGNSASPSATDQGHAYNSAVLKGTLMAHVPKILAFAGSTRTDSYNKKLIKVAIKGAEAAGAQVTYLDLRDLNLPLYDGDLEASEGLPAGARKLKDLLLANDGIMISSPEYNSSISGVLKNAIDWA